MNREIIDQINEQSKQQNAEGLENETSIGKRSFAEEELEGLKQDRAERKKYAKWTFIFLCAFTSIILAIISLAGWGNKDAKIFHLSNSVLITLITTSLSTIVGIFILVMTYLFNKNKK